MKKKCVNLEGVGVPRDDKACVVALEESEKIDEWDLLKKAFVLNWRREWAMVFVTSASALAARVSATHRSTALAIKYS